MLVVDSHAHIYPCYNLTRALEAARLNLAALAKEALSLSQKAPFPLSAVTRALILTERQDCHFFDSLASGGCNVSEYRFTALKNGQSKKTILRATAQQGDWFYIVPGRQVITAERLEILALGTNQPIQDGFPWKKLLEEIAVLGAHPVLCWSPGKWLFARGKVVQDILSEVKPRELSMGDTALRPQRFPKPSLMRQAERAGFAILAGSDPLPLQGEEQCVGCYGTFWKTVIDEGDPLPSIFKALHAGGQTVGRRHHFLKVASKLFRNWASARMT